MTNAVLTLGLMATSLSARKAALRLTTYTSSIRNISASVSQIRKFSGFEDKNPRGFLDSNTGVKPVSWPDDVMGPLNTPDFRFALPGNVGVPAEQNSAEKQQKPEPEPDLISGDSSERHLTVMSQFIAESDYLDPESNDCTTMSDSILCKYFENARVELTIQDCPKIVKKDFASLFPDIPSSGKLTVVTVTQRTENDMSGWSQDVDEERENLLEKFISTATEICHMLRAHQYWCDFIDPSSGQAFFGPYTNSTFYETDERYRHLGLEIEDLGCCKVIFHKKWGSKVFVGSIFTMAPKEHKVMQDLLTFMK